MEEDIYIHSDEGDEFIGRLIQTFGLGLKDLGLYSGMTFQELIDNTILKVGLQQANDCTTQIAFYKVRKVMVEELGIGREQIRRNAKLKDLFPHRNRKRSLGIICERLGVKNEYFQPPSWLLLTCTAVLVASFVLLFFNFLIGAFTFNLTLTLAYLVKKLRTSLLMKTLGELVERLTRDNLMKLREGKESINPYEIRTTIIKLIDDLHGLHHMEIKPEQKIIFG